MSEAVHWDPKQGVIGIVGVAPIATADFYTKLSKRQVNKDWEHPRILIDSNPKIPSRGRYLELHETNPVPFFRESINTLIRLGATIVAIPCNTAHILYKEYSANFTIYIPNIIEITSQAAKQSINNVSLNVLVLSSRLVAQHHLYNDELKKVGLCPVKLNNQCLVDECIEAVKQGKDTKTYNRKLIYNIRKFASQTKIGAIILGCTELSVLMMNTKTINTAKKQQILIMKTPVPLIDSNQALADVCYNNIMKLT